MTNNMKIDVHHITRVEGHGNIKVDIEKGELKECKLEIVEAPRFFEAMLKGRHFDEAALITSRICGICSVGHQLASIHATEDAFGIKISEQEMLLRRLMNCGEHFESHVLHIYFLAVPDFVGAKSVLPLVNTHKDVVIQALKLKKLGHHIGDVIGGRLVHSMAMYPKAMSKVPTDAELEDIIEQLNDAKEELKKGIKTLQSLKLPAFERETEYISLYKEGTYAFLEGNIYSSDTSEASYKNYLDMTNEYLVDHSTAKHAKHHRNEFMVGALARFNNSHAWLSDSDDALEAAQKLLNLKRVVENRQFTLKACSGVGVVEAPRGILYHEYTYDKKGLIQKANCVIPTGQNLSNIEADFRALLPTIMDKSQEEVTLMLEMIVRAYDPCISCSAHILNVEFVND